MVDGTFLIGMVIINLIILFQVRISFFNGGQNK